MGRTSSSGLPKGTRARSGKIQINFKWNDKREWFTLDLTDTPANFSKAAKIREDFVNKAKYGILKIEDIEAVTAKPIKKADAAQKTLPASNAPTFAHYAQEYLYNLSDHKQGTKKKIYQFWKGSGCHYSKICRLIRSPVKCCVQPSMDVNGHRLKLEMML